MTILQKTAQNERLRQAACPIRAGYSLDYKGSTYQNDGLTCELLLLQQVLFRD